MGKDTGIGQNDVVTLRVQSLLKELKDSDHFENLNNLLQLLQSFSKPFIMHAQSDGVVCITYNENKNLEEKKYKFSTEILDTILDKPIYPIGIVCNNKGCVLSVGRETYNKQQVLEAAQVRQNEINVQTKLVAENWSYRVGPLLQIQKTEYMLSFKKN